MNRIYLPLSIERRPRANPRVGPSPSSARGHTPHGSGVSSEVTVQPPGAGDCRLRHQPNPTGQRGNGPALVDPLPRPSMSRSDLAMEWLVALLAVLAVVLALVLTAEDTHNDRASSARVEQRDEQ